MKKIKLSNGAQFLNQMLVDVAHLAFEIPGENTSNEWLEAVSDEEYNLLK